MSYQFLCIIDVEIMSDFKILLVEDDEFIRDIYQEVLVGEGYDLTVAVDGGEAFEKLKIDGWDLVLLDVMMPKMTGIQVIQKLKKEGNKKGYKKVIFLTNMDDPEEVVQFKKLGDGYLIKSDLTPPELIEKVKALLSAK